jgi:ADP-ribose pyrophosphatase YjhB (NUDIX family)
MVKEEIQSICQKDFDTLWNELWVHKHKYNQYEYKNSKTRFESLKQATDEFNLETICQKIEPLYTSPEWGFPKGRRNLHEKNLACATREFQEETSYSKNDIQLLDKLIPSQEVFKGTNGIPYKHIYFPAYCLFPKKTSD